jgi:hypothetical protein
LYIQKNRKLLTFTAIFKNCRNTLQQQQQQQQPKQLPVRSASKSEWNTRFYLDPMPSYNVTTDKHTKQYTGTKTFQKHSKKALVNGVETPTEEPKNNSGPNPSKLRRAFSASPKKKKMLALNNKNGPLDLTERPERQKSAPASDQKMSKSFDEDNYFDFIPEELPKRSTVWQQILFR